MHTGKKKDFFSNNIKQKKLTDTNININILYNYTLLRICTIAKQQIQKTRNVAYCKIHQAFPLTLPHDSQP